MILNCLKGNDAIGFYKAIGGKIVGHRSDNIKGGVIEEDILYYDISKKGGGLSET